jgi:uncharacterized membrane protein
MYGYGWAMLLWWFILMVAVFFAVAGWRQRCRHEDHHERPLDILKRRRANGDITQIEFERLKRELK